MVSQRKYTSKYQRQNQKLLRNEYEADNKWGIPLMRKSQIQISDIKLIPFDHTIEDDRFNLDKTVHFFLEDGKQEKVYDNPDKYISRLAQYVNVLTPDFSLYTDMPLAIQIYNVFKSRWCGAKWQELGLSVIPTISWSTNKSYDFCFTGIEYGSAVAISTLGGLKKKSLFLAGYFEMRERINPQHVLCFGKTFTEMGNEVIFVDYNKTIRRIK
jgi:hypothetical protein